MQVKKQQLKTDMEQWTNSKSGKESQGCLLSPRLFNFYAEYIIQNAGLDESQGVIKIARRNINKFRYADDTILRYGRETKVPLDEDERGSEKADKNSTFKKLTSRHLVPSLHGK